MRGLRRTPSPYQGYRGAGIRCGRWFQALSRPGLVPLDPGYPTGPRSGIFAIRIVGSKFFGIVRQGLGRTIKRLGTEERIRGTGCGGTGRGTKVEERSNGSEEQLGGTVPGSEGGGTARGNGSEEALENRKESRRRNFLKWLPIREVCGQGTLPCQVPRMPASVTSL